MLSISAPERLAIQARAEAGYPNEVCGFLLGHAAGPEDRRVVRHRAVANAWESAPELRRALLDDRGGDRPTAAEWEAASEERRFLIDPRDFAAVDREAQADGLTIVGFYHSHPDHPAIPSRFDRDLAIPEQSYVIVSVRGGQAVEFRSWSVPDFDAGFEEEVVPNPA